jgi:hypothetical protein
MQTMARKTVTKDVRHGDVDLVLGLGHAWDEVGSHMKPREPEGETNRGGPFGAGLPETLILPRASAPWPYTAW